MDIYPVVRGSIASLRWTLGEGWRMLTEGNLYGVGLVLVDKRRKEVHAWIDCPEDDQVTEYAIQTALLHRRAKRLKRR